MWYEELGIITAEHIRSHIGPVLEEVSADYDDGIVLIQPKMIETDNLVGGVYSVDISNLPAYAVDVLNKSFAGPNDNDYLYQYTGHIAMIVTASSEESANKMIKRHVRAMETFVRSHQFIHQAVVKEGEAYLHEFGFAGSALSGAAKVDEENNRTTWIAGARVDVVWVTRESGWYQHG